MSLCFISFINIWQYAGLLTLNVTQQFCGTFKNNGSNNHDYASLAVVCAIFLNQVYTTLRCDCGADAVRHKIWTFQQFIPSATNSFQRLQHRDTIAWVVHLIDRTVSMMKSGFSWPSKCYICIEVLTSESENLSLQLS